MLLAPVVTSGADTVIVLPPVADGTSVLNSNSIDMVLQRAFVTGIAIAMPAPEAIDSQFSKTHLGQRLQVLKPPPK